MGALGERIRRARMNRGLTGAQLAERIGSTQAFISRVERGLRKPSLEMLDEIAEALGTTPAALLAEEPKEEKGVFVSLLDRLPEKEQAEVFDFLLYKIQRQSFEKAHEPALMTG